MNIYGKKIAFKTCRLMLMAVGICCFTACSDTWDDHYDKGLATSDKSLLQLIEDDDQLGDFLKVINTTKVYNNSKKTDISFADLLNSDQTLTVWAPKDGTFNIDSLLAECETEKGDSMVAQHFVMNHISHNLYSMGPTTNTTALMLNGKQAQVTANKIRNASLVQGNSNNPAKNGLLHVISDDINYSYNIYEGLTSLDEYSHLGDYLLKYEKQELDENRSIQSGLVDGEKVYSDSVMKKENPLFNVFGKINSEDSAFVMLLPDEKIWRPVYEEALPYFDYGSVAKADSISNYWVNRMLMQDLFYNRNMQHLADSAFSTSYAKNDPEYHVYYKPLAAGGIFSDEYVADSIEGSNGVYYKLRQWPFTKQQLYFWPIKVETEREANMLSYSDCTLEYRDADADTISGGYLRINPKTSSSNWTCTFEVANTLAGTYDICVVLLPKTVYNTASRDFKPNKFVASLSYTDKEGTRQTVAFNDAMSNNPYRVDTVKIGTFTFPVCNYKQNEVTVQLTLTCSMTRRETSYSRDMYLDCIYLKPKNQEEE